jgi:hypothetical protein
MAITVKKAVLWRGEVENHPGGLAAALEPLAQAGADLQLVMAYHYPGTDKGTIELHPISGRKPIAAAQTAGLARSSTPVLLVEGDNRPGLGHALAKAIGDAGVNMSFVMAQVISRKYSAVFGFENEADVAKAATLIKKAAAPVRKKIASETRPRDLRDGGKD